MNDVKTWTDLYQMLSTLAFFMLPLSLMIYPETFHKRVDYANDIPEAVRVFYYTQATLSLLAIVNFIGAQIYFGIKAAPLFN